MTQIKCENCFENDAEFVNHGGCYRNNKIYLCGYCQFTWLDDYAKANKIDLSLTWCDEVKVDDANSSQ